MSEQPPDPADLDAPRRRPAPTIDLTATELHPETSEPAEPVAAAPEESEAAVEESAPASVEEAPEPGREAEAAQSEHRAGPPPPPPEASSATHVPPRRGGIGTHLGAGILGAIVVLAVLAGLWHGGVLRPGAGDQGQAQANAARIAALENRVGELARGIQSPPAPAPSQADTKALQDLSARVAKLEAAPHDQQGAPSSAAPDEAVTGRLDAAEAATKSLTADVADLHHQAEAAAGTAAAAAKQAEAATKQADAAAQAVQSAQEAAQSSSKAAQSAQGAAEAAQGAAQSAQTAAQSAQTAAQSAQGAAQAAQQAADTGSAKKDIAALAARVDALEQARHSGQDAVAADLRATHFAVSAVALHDAVDAGMPFRTELAAVKPYAGSDVDFAPLDAFAATGIKRPMEFNRELADLGPAMLRIAQPQNQDGHTFLDKLQANAERLVRIRRIEDAPGDDPAAIVGRIEARAVRMTVSEALAEVEKLPPAVRAPAEDWIKRAQMRVAAIELSRKLESQALGGLDRQNQ